MALIGLFIVLIGPVWFGVWFGWETYGSPDPYQPFVVPDREWVGAMMCLLLAPIGMLLLIRAGIWSRFAKWDALARANALTQPLPRFQAPPLDVVAPRLHNRPPKYPHRRLIAPGRPAFTKMSWIGLVVLLCYVAFAIPAWVILRPVGPIGLMLHLWKPGTKTENRAVMPAVFVRLTGARNPNWTHVPPLVYVDSQLVSREDLTSVLQRKLTQRPPHWPVYLDADPAMEWGDAVQVIELIRGLGVEVILLSRQQRTEKMRDH